MERIGLEIRSKSLHEIKDDPYHVLSIILKRKKVETIIDAGASIGETSPKLANIFPNAKVHAIEPYEPFCELIRGLKKEQPRVIEHQVALSDNDGVEELNINKSKGTNSLLGSAQEAKNLYGNELDTTGKVKVKTQKFDSFITENKIDKIDILKLDLQGNEYAALTGAKNTLEEGNIKVIMCEILFANHYKNQSDPVKLLELLIGRHDFEIFSFYQSHYHRGKLLQTDAILIHASIIKDVLKSAKKGFHAHSKLPLV